MEQINSKAANAFKAFLDQFYPENRREFARKAGLSVGHVYNLENGRRKFSRNDMVKIHVASGGLFSFEDMVADDLELAARV